MRRLTISLWALLLLFVPPAAHAQLATSFGTLTAIKVKRLPNAVVVRIETDGTIRFGVDQHDFIDFSNGYNPLPTQSIRLRLVQTRSKLPAYVPLDAYPIDGAAISLGRTNFSNPYFTDGGWGQPQPLVDVELRFATPITIRRLTVQPYRSIDFGGVLGPREASIELSNDRRAIVITLVPDRADLQGVERLNRSPVADHKHRLAVSVLSGGALRVEALHTPLRDLLAALSDASGTRFVARPEVADLDISLQLPRTSPLELMTTLARTANVATREEEGALVLGRGDEFFASRSLPLRNLSPDAARLLFPDFLLPFLRADRENNALLAVQTPLVLDKIEAQLRSLDTPRAQFEVSAQFWELSATRSDDAALRLVRTLGGDSESLNFETGEAVVNIAPKLTRQLSATLRLLQERGRARLAGNPRVTVLSGASGTLFSGQTRYIEVVQNDYFGSSVIALPLQIGAQLDVSPRGSNTPGDPIRLDIAPHLSTIDAIEAGTGLPTVGLRDLSGTLTVGEGDTIAFAGLEFASDFSTRRRALGVVRSGTREKEQRALLVLVTARRTAWREARLAPDGSTKYRGIALNDQP